MNLEREAWQVYSTIASGGIAVVPTSAGYGLLAMTRRGVERIYESKGRPTGKPCVTVSTWPVFDDVAAPIDASVRRWIAETIQTAPLAVVARARPRSSLLASLDPFVRAHCTRDDTIATFHQAGRLVTKVAEIACIYGRLVVGSSANRSGAGNAYTLDEVPAREDADLVIDCGPIPSPDGAALSTTILDLPNGRFLREGIHFRQIRDSWEARFGQESLAAG